MSIIPPKKITSKEIRRNTRRPNEENCETILKVTKEDLKWRGEPHSCWGALILFIFFSTDLEKSYNSRGGGIDFDEIILKYHLGKKCMRTANKILKSKSIL